VNTNDEDVASEEPVGLAFSLDPECPKCEARGDEIKALATNSDTPRTFECRACGTRFEE
jgi:hypothetical protein